MLKTTLRNIVAALVLGGLTFASAGAFADAPKVPQTVEEHMVLGKTYQEKAAGYRKEAQEHRDMVEASRKSTVNAQEKRGQRNPWVVKMEKHCAAIATAAEKLATEAQKAADYHTLRAKELQGK